MTLAGFLASHPSPRRHAALPHALGGHSGSRAGPRSPCAGIGSRAAARAGQHLSCRWRRSGHRGRIGEQAWVRALPQRSERAAEPLIHHAAPRERFAFIHRLRAQFGIRLLRRILVTDHSNYQHAIAGITWSRRRILTKPPPTCTAPCPPLSPPGPGHSRIRSTGIGRYNPLAQLSTLWAVYGITDCYPVHGVSCSMCTDLSGSGEPRCPGLRSNVGRGRDFPARPSAGAYLNARLLLSAGKGLVVW